MGYICTKKLNLSGKAYHPGEAIPDDAFYGGSAAKLLSYGYVAEAGTDKRTVSVELTASEDTPVISVVFSDGEASICYPVSTEQLQAIADIMQMGTTEIAEKVDQVKDETVLIFIQKVDSRKTVRDAVQRRLEALFHLPAQSASEAPADSPQ